jgi:DNA segregation ATPase FtsK/SpoIIIE, S-DNA-T family
MSPKENQPKRNTLKNSSVPKNTSKGTKPKVRKKGKAFSFLKNEKYHLSVGVFLALLSIYLLFVFTSYLLNYFAGGVGIDDQTASESFGNIVFNDKLPVNNWGGRLGAFFGWQFIKGGFGIASYIFVFLLFLGGIKLALKVKLLPYWRTLLFGLILVVWLSVTMGFFFRENELSVLAGVFGTFSSGWLEGLMGRVGTGILLLFVIIVYLVFTVNLKLSGLVSEQKPKQPKEEEEDEDEQDDELPKNVPKEDKFNTVEFAIDEKEGGSWSFAGKKTEPEVKQATPASRVVSKPNPAEQIAEVELTIEQPSGNGNLPLDNIKEDTGHFTIDTPFDPTLDLASYRHPTFDLLDDYSDEGSKVQKEELEANKNRIVQTLGNYSIQIEKIRATIGPAVTLYEIIPAPGIRISRIKNLEDDIALSLSALGIRIIAPIPGKGTIGIEVPNQNPEIVSMKSILSSERFMSSKYELPFGMGKTIQNETFVADLTRMPHILMAGATGQGKSVGLNAIIASLLFKKHPSQVKFVMIDPKKVELTLFSKIERHFLAKLPDSEEAIITDTRKVVRTLNSLNLEMDMRYDLLKDAQVRNIKEYNTKFISRRLNPNESHRFLPYIVVIIDEFADLIMTAGKEIEVPLTRLAQLARAIGIHLVIATQRPSVNIITGSIKANFPARFAFRVISKIDSRTILDSSGAEQLIGRGDMLLSTGSDVMRLQCAFIDIHEIDKITDFIGSQRGYPDAFHLPEYYDEETEASESFDPNERDELFEDAARIIVAHQQGSTSLLQRKLKLGYNRAGRIIDQLEQAGIVGPFEGSKAREVRVAGEIALEQFLKDLYGK